MRHCTGFSALLIAIAGFGLAGCNSEEDGGGGQTSVSIVGLWDGIFLGNPFGAESAIAVIQGGRFMMVDNNDVVYDGLYEPSGRTGFIAQQVRRANANGSAGPDLSITGSVVTDNQSGQLLTLRILEVGSTNIPDDLQLVPNPVYQQGSSLAQVADFWGASLNPSLPLIFNIQNAGGANIDAQDDSCTYGGVISPQNIQRNLYTVNISISPPGCAVSGQYSGFAALYEGGDLLRMILASDSRGLYFPLERP